jgi:hypothetical protein
VQALRTVVAELQESLNRGPAGARPGSKDLLVSPDSCPHCHGPDAPSVRSLTGKVHNG